MSIFSADGISQFGMAAMLYRQTPMPRQQPVYT
jgi:hypothetical protein